MLPEIHNLLLIFTTSIITILFRNTDIYTRNELIQILIRLQLNFDKLIIILKILTGAIIFLICLILIHLILILYSGG
jgi:hypothetical protein